MVVISGKLFKKLFLKNKGLYKIKGYGIFLFFSVLDIY